MLDVQKIDLVNRVLELELEPAWNANPDDSELDRELSLAGKIFGANPFKTAHAIAETPGAARISQLRGLPSDESPFHVWKEPAIALPKRLSETLAKIYGDFQELFALPEGHQEWESDYRFCLGSGIAMPAVQIDMAALSNEEIEAAEGLSDEALYNFLRNKIFEIEGSIAAYGMLSNLFEDRLWGKHWQAILQSYRDKYQRPIFLLAPTQEKYESMLGYEFGLSPEEIEAGKVPTAAEVKAISGFDAFLGPVAYLELVKGLADIEKEHPLLYVRASNPLDKLRDPEVELGQPLLSDPELRRLIRAFSLTVNIDDPNSPFPQHVNDTKAYMPLMKLGYEVRPDRPETGLWISNQSNSNGSGSLKLMGKNKDNALILGLRDFLSGRGIDPEGDFFLRAKPLVDTFGGYGHLKLKFQNGRPGKMHYLDEAMKARGPYILQPELATHSRQDAAGTLHREIWRVFYGTNALSGEIEAIAGVVNSIPATSMEVRGKVERVHGNTGATFREILL